MLEGNLSNHMPYILFIFENNAMQCLQYNAMQEDLLYFVVLLHKNKFTSARDPEGGNDAV